MAKELPPPGLLQGTLDMLILQALQHGPMHGFGIAGRNSGINCDAERGPLNCVVMRVTR